MSPFQHAVDIERERAIAVQLEECWRCTVHHYPPLSPVDWYMERDGRMVAQAELKTANIASTETSRVWITFSKLLALQVAALCSGLPSLFVIAFTDSIWFINVADIPPGCTPEVRERAPRPDGRRGPGDRTPVIRIPTSALTPLVTNA